MNFLNKFFVDEKNSDKPSNITVDEKNNNEETQIKMNNNKPEDNHANSIVIEKKMTELATEYSKLRSSLKFSLFSERDTLVTDKEKTEQHIADLTNRQSQYTEQKNELSTQDDSNLKNQLAGDKQQLENQIELAEKYKEQNNGVEEELQLNEAALTKVNSSLDSNKQAEDSLSEEIKNETDLKKMYALMDNQKKAVANLYEEREQLNHQRDSLLSKKAELSEENEQLLSNINETNSTASQIKAQISQLERQIHDNSQKRTQTISQLTGQLSNVENELIAANNHLTTTNKNIKNLDNKIQTTFNSNHLVRDVEFDQEKTYAILQSSNDTTGNLTGDIYDFVSDKSSNKVLTLTSQPFNNLSNISDVIDLYHDLQQSSKPTNKRVSIQDKEGWKTVKEEGVTKIYDDSDKLLMTVFFDNQLISSINYFTDDKLNKTNFYNKDGILSLTKFFNDKESITEETYYRTDGSTVLTKQFESEQLTSIQLFDEDGLQTNVFSSELQLIKWWFENTTKQFKNIVLIGDPTDEVFKNLSSDKELNAQTLVYLDNVHSNIGRIRALLHSKPLIYDILVTNQDDLQSIEDITDRDINVSVITETAYESNSEKLPKALI
ncbi:hypothetical protein RD055328_13410 [Companilactobacillus sp. RD055328]|uniref:hypothetical protein n=1 Tax=Companilactobacillus sp. RD055328 TaxID=2916634 RepID=UPI001FC7D878|nr:hypothetical protein [Companilactobacillus sp. RD055328]GKQ43418.1 hypothetical protein RD055328_13410 [Companilactobacillus sp. RD055328]